MNIAALALQAFVLVLQIHLKNLESMDETTAAEYQKIVVDDLKFWRKVMEPLRKWIETAVDPPPIA